MNSAVVRAGEALLGWLGPISLATGAVLLGALVIDRLLERRVSAGVRALLYLAVLARLALPAAWESPLGLLGGRAPATVTAGAIDLSAVTVTPLASAPASTGPGWLALGWAAVTLGLLGRWLHARWSLARRLRQATPLGFTAEGTPVLRHPELGPLVAGLWRPRIVVPASLADAADGETLGWVLRHEQAHVRRRDLLVGALVQLVCLLAWPVLPLWIAARRLRALMEVACDEQAVRGADGPARRRYGEVLLAMAEHATAGRALGPVLAFGSPLRGRLRALGRRRRWPLPVQALVVAATGALVFACAGEPSEEVVAGDAQVDAVEVSPAAAATGGPGATPAAVRKAASTPAGFRPANGIADPFGPGPARAAASPPPITRSEPIDPPTVVRAGRRDLIVTISRGGELFLGKRKVTLETLEDEVRRELARRGTDTVLLRGDKEVYLSRAADMMGILKRAGARNLALLSAPAPAAPPAEIRGALDREVIRGVIQKEISSVKACYERGLERRPEMRGKLTVRFTIDGKGTVIATEAASSTLGDPTVDACVLAAVERWRFPAPAGGGIVIVSYPFDFQPSQPEARKVPDGSPQQVAETVRMHMKAVKACYDRHLLHSPAASGRIVFRWTILPSGEVRDVKPKGDDLGDVSGCIATLIPKMGFRPFPGITGPLEVEFPFVFSSTP